MRKLIRFNPINPRFLMALLAFCFVTSACSKSVSNEDVKKIIKEQNLQVYDILKVSHEYNVILFNKFNANMSKKEYGCIVLSSDFSGDSKAMVYLSNINDGLKFSFQNRISIGDEFVARERFVCMFINDIDLQRNTHKVLFTYRDGSMVEASQSSIGGFFAHIRAEIGTPKKITFLDQKGYKIAEYDL